MRFLVRMNKFFIFLFLFSFLYPQAPNWTSEQEITLSRNQVYKLNLLIRNSDVREFKFHWTLYTDKGLVFLAKYDGFNHQTILYNTHRKDSFKIRLAEEGKMRGLSPYLVVFFKKYDEKSKQATFKVVTYGDVYVQ